MDLVLGPGPDSRLKRGAVVWVAFSGGLDSTVLLHRLLAAKWRVRAVHVDHQLQAASRKWIRHCREFCRRLGVPLDVVSVEVDPQHDDGPEAAARDARYEAFRGLMRPGDWLAMAHHQDDQAETVLLRLMRGSGVTGLAAMKPVRDFAPGYLWRPLLKHSREELRRYAVANNLRWIEDPHNADPRFSRSFLRKALFPKLAGRWPKAIPSMARSAEHCAEASQLLDELAARDAEVAKGAGESLSVAGLLKMSPARRNNLLRYRAAAMGREVPPFAALEQVEREVLRARVDASPVMSWGSTELRRYRDGLFLMERLPVAPEKQTLDWDGRADLVLPSGCGRLVVTGKPRNGLSLWVRFSAGGEKIKPAGSRHTRTLRNLFQEAGVPGWVRERIPLIGMGDELAAVSDRWRTSAFKKVCETSRFKYTWSHELMGF